MHDTAKHLTHIAAARQATFSFQLCQSCLFLAETDKGLPFSLPFEGIGDLKGPDKHGGYRPRCCCGDSESNGLLLEGEPGLRAELQRGCLRPALEEEAEMMAEAQRGLRRSGDTEADLSVSDPSS